MTDPDKFADSWAKAQEDAYQKTLEDSDRFNEWCDKNTDDLTQAINKGNFESTFPTSWGYNTVDEILGEYIAQKFTMIEIAKLVIDTSNSWLPDFEAWYRDMLFEYGEME